MLRRFLVAALLLLIAVCSGTVAAQSSVIVGTVFDAASKRPVADVVVTATSPNLQGEQAVITDAQGNYRIPRLPPGAYTLRLEADAYKPYTRSDIQLRLNLTVRVNVELLPNSSQKSAGHE